MNIPQPVPAVSVVIPVYNTEKYLRQCLDSIAGQTMKDMEIICVNDGSTDGSPAVLREYADRDPRFRIISQENRGLSATRNAGMDAARGNYLYFIDSDDFLDAGALERLYAQAARDDLDMLFFDSEVLFENEALAESRKTQKFRYQRGQDYVGIWEGPEYFRAQIENGKYTEVVNMMLSRRAFLEEHHLRFLNPFPHEDNLFHFECLLLARRVSHAGASYYHYRQRENSQMTMPLSERNIAGCLFNVAHMLRAVEGRSFSPGTEAAILKYILDQWRCSVWQRSGALPPEKLRRMTEAPGLYNRALAALYLKVYPLEAECARARAECAQLKQEQRELSDENGRRRRELSALRGELNALRASRSFRIGRAATWLPRKIRGGIRCWRDHGLLCTLKRAWRKIQEKALSRAGIKQ